jgi:hypothetical protein
MKFSQIVEKAVENARMNLGYWDNQFTIKPEDGCYTEQEKEFSYDKADQRYRDLLNFSENFTWTKYQNEMNTTYTKSNKQ